MICATRVGRRLAQKDQSILQLFLDFEGLNDVKPSQHDILQLFVRRFDVP